MKNTIEALALGGLILAATITGCKTPNQASNAPRHQEASKGWTYNPQNGHEYKLTKPETWIEAAQEARAAGGYLVSINSPQENAWIVDNFKGYDTLWIGLSDETGKGNFKWESGEPFKKSNFESWNKSNGYNDGGDEPNNLGREPRVYMFGYSKLNLENSMHGRNIGGWNNVIGDDIIPGVIERVRAKRD